jgi:hypothetical protein
LASFINVANPECDGVGYGSATVSPTGGTAPYSYHWNFGGGVQPTNSQCLVGTNVVTVTDAMAVRLKNRFTLPSTIIFKFFNIIL